ncbi:hypothetical protein [Paenibacillus sp. P32E]|uniref:hypothetical protein n=1 Tax=Paenibacillus sp. P32E TaxID=1349434 RepID=UPI00093C96D6|nr:hypothetical protein [Paenibacillus sp. P32E]OKP84383.1 hypothetical protein A3848_24180 [Paenibacillus sp. P32E]
MNQALKTTIRLGMTASVLIALTLPLTAHAADKVQVYETYQDEVKGIELYSVSQLNGDHFDSAVIARQADGSYAKWQEPFHSFVQDGSGLLRLSGYDDPEQSYVYDVKKETIIRKTPYTVSPDGKWGYLERSRYLFVPGVKPYSGHVAKIRDYYLKNMQTRAVSIYNSTERRFDAFWLNGHTLLENGYLETAKQNVIRTYDPATGERKELLKGSLYNWNRAKGILLYVKNEPQRLPWIYDLKTGTSRLLDGNSEMKALFPYTTPPLVSKLPQEIAVNELPVIQVPVLQENEYFVNVDGTSIGIPAAFAKEGVTWIPVKPLAAALGWSLLLQPQLTSYKAASYQYELTNRNASLVLTPSNSFITGGRMYLTREQLKQLGYSSIVLTPNMDY